MQKRDQKVVIAGGSGFLGNALATYLVESGYPPPVILARSKPTKDSAAWSYVHWDGRSLGAWSTALDGSTAIVNLCGRTVDCIKTPDHQDEILRSRVESTRVLGRAMKTIANPPNVWVQMSTAHIYGDPPVAECDEDSPAGYGLAPTVAKAWESEFHASVLESQRKVILRTSFVVGQDRGAGAGALGKLGWLVKIGLGGTVGSGKQGMSWIHETDMNRLFERAITDERMNGVYVASSPNPVSQKDFMKALRKAISIPFGLPAAEWMVRLGAPLLLKTDPELALYGRYVISRRLSELGFEFSYPLIEDALAEIYG